MSYKYRKLLKDKLDNILSRWDNFYGRSFYKDGLYVFITGGKSDNEDLLNSLDFVDWSVCKDYIKAKGGFYVIAISEKGAEFLNSLRQQILK
jgi:hypothetical protein